MTETKTMKILPIPNNGYYSENSSNSLVLETYHTTYISFNLTNIHSLLTHLFTNHLTLQKKSENLYPTEHSLQIQLNYSYNQLKDAFDNFHKITHSNIDKRKRRGLINFLGSTIKFFTGNLDQEDLKIINEQFEKGKTNQINTMHKLNKLSSFAGHISERFQKDIVHIYNNTQILGKSITNISNLLDLSLQIQNHYMQINMINSYLNKLLRTIILAITGTLNIELLSINEIEQIWNFLKFQYNNQLWRLDQLYELTLICNTGFITKNKMAILVVKIPLFLKNSCKLQIVYPIPTVKQLILVPPSKYYCDDLWYEKCSSINNKWFCSNQLIDSCQIKNCTYAKITNNYEIAFFTKNDILLYCVNKPTEIMENCDAISKQTMINCNLILSKCNIIIGNKKYYPKTYNITLSFDNIDFVPQTNRSINLRLFHVNEPDKMHDDLFEPIDYNDCLTKATHHSIIGIIIIVIISIVIINVIVYKRRIRDSVSKHILRKLITEDVDNSKEGGITDLDTL